MFFPTLYLIFIFGGLVPVYVLFWMHFVMKKRRSMSFIQHIFVFTIGVAIFCASMIHLESASALSGVVPTKLEFPIEVKSVRLQDVKVPDEFHHFNPSILRVDDGKHYIITLREGNFNNCPMKDEYPKINVFSFNRVLVGVGTSREGPFKLSFVIEKPYDENGGRLQGYEDARLIPMGRLDKNGDATDDVGILVAHKNQLLFFRYNVRFDARGRSFFTKQGNESQVRLIDSREGEKQKNWMFIPPRDIKHVQETARFVQWINPLTVVEMNSNGVAHVLYKAPYISCIAPSVHGSTNFLREPDNPRKLFGLVHMRYDSYSFVAIPFYNSAIVEIEESEDGQRYHIIGMSNDFRFPASNEVNKSHRIHFPMSMMYTDSKKDTVSISMGYMDCTAHIVTVKTSDFLKSIKSFYC